MSYFIDSSFNADNFSTIVQAEYEHCTFEGCNFSDFNFADYKFMDCNFINCDFSNALVSNAAFREVNFNDCKMLGLDFEYVNSFGFSINIKNCNMMHSSFYKIDLRKSKFIKTLLKNVDFTEANLSKIIFDHCNLSNAVFNRSNLQGCDFRSAFDFIINPENNNIKKAKFSTSNIIGLLDQFDIIVE